VKVKVSRSVTAPVVTALGERLVSHAGVGMLAETADLAGLTGGISRLFGGHGHVWRDHDPGVSVVQAAVSVADGMTNISAVGQFVASRGAVFVNPASVSTTRRTVFTFGEELMSAGLDAVMCDARTRAWDAAGYAPASLTLDFDATLLTCHSEKEQAAPTYKSGFGFHPLGCWLDETREPLAMILRKGNAGSNTATDHRDVLFRSLEQLPVRFQIGHQPGDPAETVVHPILVRCDGAGSTKAFLADLVERNIEFSVGFSADQTIRDLIVALPEEAWIPAINHDHTHREGAKVAQIRVQDPESGWPARSRLICRREDPHPGAPLSIFDQIQGRRHTLFLTNSTEVDIAGLERRHRGHARVEDRIRTWKATGAVHQPYKDFAANQAWLNVTLIAQTLLAWTQLIGFTGPLQVAEPATFRTKILHIAGQNATRARQHFLHLDRTWPWVTDIVNAYNTIRQAFAVP